MNTDHPRTVDDLVQAWTLAERSNDADALDPLLASDFMAVGPAGFVLDRDDWLERFRSGDLKNLSFDWETASLRQRPGCAIVVGLQRQDTRYRGQSNPGDFRGTLIAVEDENLWRLIGLHLSPLGWRPGPQPSAGPAHA